MRITLDGKVSHICGMCGAKSSMKLSEDEMWAFREYLRDGRLIQECLPALNKCEYEFLKSGYLVEYRYGFAVPKPPPSSYPTYPTY